MESISLVEARRALIRAQGLASPPRKNPAKADVLAAIERMAVLQIDTISVVARSPYFVLWSRLGGYEPRWLDELLAEGAIFEAWAHAACFVPSSQFPVYRRRTLDGAHRGGVYWKRWMAAHEAEAAAVLDHVRTNGPARSADFEGDGKRGAWWDWKSEKIALEMLFQNGDLMIARRQGFQRVYDLTERVRPGWDDRDAPSGDEAARAMVLQSIRALGVTKPEWVWQYLHLERKPSLQAVRELLNAGEITEVTVEGFAKPWVMPADGAALAGRRPSRTVLLTPFDPIVWDRDRGRELFGFDYTIECYTPEPKRRYGYFSLPILHGDGLVGRLDAKAHRKDGLFEVKALHLEPGVPPSDALVAGLGACLRECAAWHGTPDVLVRKSDPEGLAERVQLASSA